MDSIKIIHPKIHLIVLNWNDKELSGKCLSSIEKVSYPNYEVLIVDNNSKDGSVEFFKENFSQYDVLSLEDNLKYAGGNNAAVEYLKPKEEDFLVFINNDTIVSSDFLDHLISPFLNDANCIITVPKILFAMDINKIWYAGGIVNMWKGKIDHIGIRNFDGPRYSFMMETDYATGCCLCINSADFKKLNYFDTMFNMYCEDVDLSIRAKKMNRKIVYSPKSIILHSVSQSLGENSFKKIQNKLLGQVKLFWKHASGLQIITLTFHWLLFYLPLGFLKWIYFKLKEK
ncbi:MAG: glycosyltransferase family 2 protein [Candidatus Marinimicrobia bacterium]|jgi:GT2 family glycosyltransferase|nr:glycosyltransferase family 2 protein [Candidatus Neomarinimicrobiota bacterium]MBT3727856.1 glycosyltransferase family 2 protein [Candidatus Neomarinimicrobiota bacterium]MBT4112343.1 glycosyltransferase family 2 protein [Candidatus Neomarinimicrobiota bacterium]MBT4316696.1 glycosyltransferase family 2 protein [Candidatus Neomarinimicrobiota bacterium]MBT4706753.1 glycosyltransferase family 2 protein [Candidatus Neomarinimicrobiota bacterium]